MYQEQSFSKSSRNLLILVLFITTLTTLPWIGLGDFYTKGEPREASVAVSMLDDKNWILPRVYADETAFKPPFTHWMMAALSLPTGEVTPFTSRLPSTIAFIAMIGCCFGFFRRFMNKHESLIAVFILISSFELHRSALTARVDMVLTAFMVAGIISLFYWAENKQLKGLPWYIPVFLGCAALVKGPVGIVLPLLIFGTYLLILREKFIRIILKCLLVTVLSLIPLLVWYYLAYRQGGEYFIDIVWAENFGRFLSSDDIEVHYILGHEHSFLYNFKQLLLGFMPWTLFLMLSLFTVKFVFQRPKGLWNKITSMKREKLFSMLAACIIVIFYCIPESKRGVYLMPAYPFIAVFLGQYIYSIAMRHNWVNRTFSIFIGSIAGVILVLSILILSGVIDLQNIASIFSQREKTLFHARLIEEAFSTPSVLYITLLLCVAVSFYLLIRELRGSNQKRILYATIGVWLMCTVFLDGVTLPAFKDGTSIKPFVNELVKKYPLQEGNMYVLNSLRKYNNIYGANFYLRNRFMNFEKVRPEEGFFFSGAEYMESIKKEYSEYEFTLLEETPNRFNDANIIIQLYEFRKVQ